MGKRILILGAGPGGLEAAHTLRKGLTSAHSITLVDRESRFSMDILKGDLLTGEMKLGEKSGDRRQLSKLGINFLQGEVKSINVADREVRVGAERIGYDYLIIALGADLSPNSTKGLTGNAKTCNRKRLFRDQKRLAKAEQRHHYGSYLCNALQMS